jgi:hypothetical protein
MALGEGRPFLDGTEGPPTLLGAMGRESDGALPLDNDGSELALAGGVDGFASEPNVALLWLSVAFPKLA